MRILEQGMEGVHRYDEDVAKAHGVVLLGGGEDDVRETPVEGDGANPESFPADSSDIRRAECSWHIGLRPRQDGGCYGSLGTIVGNRGQAAPDPTLCWGRRISTNREMPRLRITIWSVPFSRIPTWPPS